MSSLRKQSKPPAQFEQREHYLVFGPIHFTCPYTDRACALITQRRDRCWQRKQRTTSLLYFPTGAKARAAKKGRQYETWPQIYFWNVDLQQYQYVGGYTDLAKRYNASATPYSNGAKPKCQSCSG